MINPVAFHDFEQAGWQKAADYYDDTFGVLTRDATEPLLDAAGVGPGVRTLDVATGPGYVAGAAAGRGATVVGLDFSPSMIQEARRRYPHLIFRDGDAEALPFGPNTFDAVVMNFGLLHLARPEVAVTEAYRVLATAGRYAFTAWALPDEAVGFGIVLRAMETFGTLDVGLPEGPPFFKFSVPEECSLVLTNAGFARVEVTKLPLTWMLSSADGLFEAACCGGVRTSAALQAQTPEALAAIRRAVHDALEPHRRGSSYALPMAVVLASAAKV